MPKKKSSTPTAVVRAVSENPQKSLLYFIEKSWPTLVVGPRGCGKTRLAISAANEIGWKTCYSAFGGWGYAHVFDHVIPWLLDCGASEDDIAEITVRNPARLHGSVAA